jgi:hypothetical protein
VLHKLFKPTAEQGSPPDLNLNHIKTLKAMGKKKLLHRDPLPTKFHENLPIGSKVISRGHTDRQVI